MMSKASRIIILCEDKLMDVVICRFLKSWGVNSRSFHVVQYPHGQGCGEKFVRDGLPEQLRAFRSRKAETVLIVAIDADNLSVRERQQQLDKTVKSAKLPPRGNNESIAYIIPKRHIETWLAHLDDNDVNESDDYKTKYEFKKCESQAHTLVDKLVKHCKNQKELPDLPESLLEACQEFERIREVLSHSR